MGSNAKLPMRRCGRRGIIWLDQKPTPPPMKIHTMNIDTAIPENVTQAAALNSSESRPSAGSTTMATMLTTSHRDLTPKTNDEADGMAHPNTVSAISQFLAKPVAVWRGSWTTASAAGTNLLNVANVWSVLYNQDVWINKLKGFYGFRATLKLKLVLNSTPFQAGCLKLSYYPVGQRATRKVSGHISHRIPISQLPGIEITTAQEGVELSIPYITPARYIELTTANQVGWGSMFLTVMSPLTVGASGSTSSGYSIWASFEDVELIGQTHIAPVTPQASRSKKLVYKRGVPPSEEELPPLASILSAGAKLAGTLRVIPTIDAVAGTAQWVLNAGKSAALSLGWSRPPVEGMMNMNPQPQRYGVTSDGMDVAIPLGMSSDAKLSVLPGLYPSRQDEMSYRFIASQWSFWQDFSFTTTAVSGDQLAVYSLNPRGFRTTVSASERYLTPVAYLAFLHQYYHGGFEMMFKFAKTGFHTGSLAFTFVPGVGGAAPTLDSGAYCYRSIVDLQEGDSVCYQLPWVIPLEYLSTAGATIGSLYVNVLNPLIAPETVAQSISVRVYIRGMEDLHFQAPVNDIYANYPVTAQGGETETFGEADCSPIGHAPTEGPTTAYAEAAASEMPLSLRLLTKRYSIAQKNPLFWTASPPSLAILPYQWSCASDPPTILNIPALQDIRGSALAAPFAFYRGGRRLRLFGCDNTKLDMSPINFAQGNTTSFLAAPTSQSAHAARTTNYADVSVPYTAVGRMCEIEWVINSTGTKSDFAPTRGIYLTSDPSATNFSTVVPSTTSFHFAGADDFEFFYWVGIPRMSNYEAAF